MAQRKPLVMKQGVISEMSAGDEMPDGAGFALVHGPAEAIEILLKDEHRFAQSLQRPGVMDLMDRWRDSMRGLRDGLNNPMVLEHLLNSPLTARLLNNANAIQTLMQTPHAWRAAAQSRSFVRALAQSDTALAQLRSADESVRSEFFSRAPLITSPRMTGLSTPSGKVSASSTAPAIGFDTYFAWFAMDGDPRTQWRSASAAGSHWLEYEFAQPLAVLLFEIEHDGNPAGKVKAQAMSGGAWVDASDWVDAPQQSGIAYTIFCNAVGWCQRWRLWMEPTGRQIGVRQMTLKGVS